MNIQQAIETVCLGQDLSADTMQRLMSSIMQGKATAAQVAGLLVGLRMKGESVDEIIAAARVLRSLADPVMVADENLIDTCGTGGDASGTFNISTTAALVAAGAGARVAKHGNRSVSGTSGSADVLEAAGVNLQLGPAQVARCIEKVGIGFLYAPNHHEAMRHASTPRRELGIRTLFNLLGPLTNPAGARRQILGVFDSKWLRPMATALHSLGSTHALVLHAEDGMDEISLTAPTQCAELVNGAIQCYTIHPQSLGIATPDDVATLKVKDVAESLRCMQAVLRDEPGACRDIVLLNAGAALYVAGQTQTIHEGIQAAAWSLRSGAAGDQLAALIEYSNHPSTT